jgi:hypothetical protein
MKYIIILLIGAGLYFSGWLSEAKDTVHEVKTEIHYRVNQLDMLND